MDEMQIPGSSTDRLVVTYAYLACSGAPASGLRTGRGSQRYPKARERVAGGPACVRSTDRARIATQCCLGVGVVRVEPASGLRTGRGSQLDALLAWGDGPSDLRPVYGPGEDRNGQKITG